MKPTITLQRACDIEVCAQRNGRPSYRWVQEWSYTQPNGYISTPTQLKYARAMAREDYPHCRIILEK